MNQFKQIIQAIEKANQHIDKRDKHNSNIQKLIQSWK